MGNPERVLVLITQLNRGGAETMTMNYYRHFDRSQIQYDFLVNRQEPGAYDEEIKDLGGRIFRMSPMYPQYFKRYQSEFRDFLHAHPEYHIIHSNLEERSYFPLRIAMEERVPVRIAHAHNEYRNNDIKTIVRNYFRHHLPPYITQGFACSTEAGNWLFGPDLMKTDKVKTVKNAIDTDKFNFDRDKRADVRKMLGINNKFVIGNVGRLAKQKNQGFLLDIFAFINKRNDNSVLLLIGEGEECESLMRKTETLGVSHDVHFVGSVPNVEDYLQAMDVFVLPSLFEGLPVSLVEAQSTGLACVASDTITREADITRDVEYISLSQSPEQWADIILHELHSDPRIGRTEDVRLSHFDIEREANKLQQFYLHSV